MQTMHSNGEKNIDGYHRGLKHAHGFEKSFSKNFSAVFSFLKLMVNDSFSYNNPEVLNDHHGNNT